MSKLAVNTGVETSGDEINWKVFDDRSEDTTITALMKDFNSTYININNLKSVYDDNITLNDYIEQFNIISESVVDTSSPVGGDIGVSVRIAV
jgi:hypothetical protein